MKRLRDAVGRRCHNLLLGKIEEAQSGNPGLSDFRESYTALHTAASAPENPPVTGLLPGEALRVAFVAQHPSSWQNFRSLWQFCEVDPRFRVKVIIAPFNQNAVATASCLDQMRNLLIKENVSFSNSHYANLASFRPHVVFIQNPYEETRPIELRMEALRAIGARVAYVPYGLELGGGAWNIRAQFDTQFHRDAWRIFVRSERSKAMFGKYCLAGNDHVRVTGHPKFDRKMHDRPLTADLLKKVNGRKIVLWTPHFSIGEPPTWSTYKLYSSEIFLQFSNRSDLCLILRPHPLFFRTMLEHGVWTVEQESDFRQFITNSSNIALHEAPDYDDVFAAADALMTDVGSFLLEFLPTRKPIIYLHHPDGLGMNDDESLTDVLYTVKSTSEIAAFLDMISEERDPLRDRREELLPRYLGHLGDSIGENICEQVYGAVAAGDSSSAFDGRAMNESLQASSEAYWQQSTNTFLAPEEYYNRKEVILREALTTFPNLGNVLDLGCGDGRFTFLLAEYAKSVLAFDISEPLIKAANETAENRGVSNISFRTSELEAVLPFEKFSLVALMGVTSCIIDDLKYLRTLDRLPQLCRKGGSLIMIDTLSSREQQMASDDTGYVAKYRPIDSYRQLLADRGFELTQETTIKEDADRSLVNKLFVYKLNAR